MARLHTTVMCSLPPVCPEQLSHPPVCPASSASLLPESRSHTMAVLSSPQVMANLPLESTRTLFSRPAQAGANRRRSHAQALPPPSRQGSPPTLARQTHTHACIHTHARAHTHTHIHIYSHTLACVAQEHMNALAGLAVPHTRSAIVGGRDQVHGVPHEAHAHDPAGAAIVQERLPVIICALCTYGASLRSMCPCRRGNCAGALACDHMCFVYIWS